MSDQTPEKETPVPRKPYHQFVDRKHLADYRREDVQALAHAIRAKENRLIVGLPGVGVSNLLRFLVTRREWREYEVFFAYLNCDTLNDCLQEETVFDEVTRQLCEQGLGQPSMGVRGYQQLKQLLTEMEGSLTRRIVIVLNKAEGMVTAVNAHFYRRLKGLSDLNKSVCYLFTATPQTAKTIDFTNPLFAGRHHYVKPFNQRDCFGVIEGEATRLGVTFENQTQSRLAMLVGGHPGLLRAVSSAVVAEKLDLLDAESTLVSRLLSRSDVQFRCYRLWQAFDETEQSALSQLAAGITAISGEQAQCFSYLSQIGLLIPRDASYTFFSPLFQGFVAAQTAMGERPLPSTSQQTTVERDLPPITIEKPSTIKSIDQEIVVAGKVLKGGEQIHLSALELRLLACLLQEPKIFTKDAIAAYVYYEEHERGVGISDALIENLVRQVRNRLGDKRYIKTHWGQGYEFMG